MCRIFGYLSDSDEDLKRKIYAVSQEQLKGGPDEQNIIATDRYGIGANRLAITDPQGGQQPYSSIDNIHIVLNGEIYNHDALRADLERDGFVFRDQCDGSILPALYVKYGRHFCEYLDGMFSIAVLDMRAGKPRFLLCTDTSGIKPVYYSYKDGTAFAFATEFPALLAFGFIPRDIWAHGVDHYLTTRAVTGGRTLLKHVHALPPGHVLEISAGTTPRLSRYETRIRYNGPLPHDANEAADIFRALLDDEVAKLARADANVCSVNSGGLDSSFVTSILAGRSDHPVSSFHVYCKGVRSFDERSYARQIAQEKRIAHYEAVIDPDAIPSLMEKTVYHTGLPNCAPHALSTLVLFQKVSREGFRVALTGEGSDELFCGHARMKAAIEDASPDWAARYIDSIGPAPSSLRASLYDADFYHDLMAQDAGAKQEMTRIVSGHTGTRSQAICHFEQNYSLPYYILHRVEPLAMASGVEVRVPYCQPKIMDFARTIDSRYFFEGEARGKAVVYGAARGHIPASIWDRPKQPFTLPVISLMHRGSPLMNFVCDTLRSSVMTGGIFSPSAIDDLISRQLNNPAKETAFMLWALCAYGLWTDLVGQGAYKDTKFIAMPPVTCAQKIYA